MRKKRIAVILLVTSMMTTTQLLLPKEAKESGRELTTISTKDKVDNILNDINTYRDKLEKQRQIEEQKRIEKEKKLEEERKAQLQPQYNPYDLRKPSNLSKEQIYQILEGNALQTLSRAFYWAEQEYHINVLFLIALTRLESGNGRSSLSISNNNLAGIKSLDGGYAYFDDWGQCLDFLTQMLDKEYLSKDGLFYNGVNIWNVNELYCERSNWSDKLNSMCYEMLGKVK